MSCRLSCCGLRPQQPAPPAAWQLLAKFISVRNGDSWESRLLGTWWEPGQSPQELFVPWHKVAESEFFFFSAGETLVPLIWFLGGEGCMWFWTRSSDTKQNFCFLFVLGWTRQEGWGRWQRRWCEHVFLLLFYFPFHLFTVPQPNSLWQAGLWGTRVVSTAESAE